MSGETKRAYVYPRDQIKRGIDVRIGIQKYWDEPKTHYYYLDLQICENYYCLCIQVPIQRRCKIDPTKYLWGGDTQPDVCNWTLVTKKYGNDVLIFY